MIEELTREEVYKTLAQIRALENSTTISPHTITIDTGITTRLRSETDVIVSILLTKINEAIRKINDLDNRVGG